ESGRQHGTQLGDQIRFLDEKYLGHLLGTDQQKFMARMAATPFSSKMDPRHLQEVYALADASGLNRNESLFAQCFLDLTPMTACSTLTLDANASPDGVARFGRNLDFPSFNIAQKYTTVFVVKPEERYAFAAIGWPGLA